ncbi:MAG TPA: antibiotic biosynthesis monooxygenase [Candidatus Angelobacter sp.]|nr:antibiotic biosynthesis monooxygenase [Candidatus Angelobacter sp.]
MHCLLIEGSFKPGKKAEFLAIWKKEILPTAKKQPGFADEVLLFGAADSGVGISFWKTKEDAERYHRDIFPQSVHLVENLLQGQPTVRVFTVEASELLGAPRKVA